MACSVCSANVEKKLQSLEGINSASVSLASRTALVDYNPDIISLEDMKREISNAGYDLVIENDRSVEEINRREFTLLRRRTLASWLFAILTMCFSMGWISLITIYFNLPLITRVPSPTRSVCSWHSPTCSTAANSFMFPPGSSSCIIRQTWIRS